MAIEQGIVTKIGPNGPATAWVKTVPTGPCASCASRHTCHEGAGAQEREVEVLNTAGASVGDRIQMSISTGSLLKATFLLYMFPILSMLIGGLAANAIAGRYYNDPSLLSAAAAAICLILAMVVVHIRGGRMGQQEAYRAKIIRVIGRASLAPSDSGAAAPCAGDEK